MHLGSLCVHTLNVIATFQVASEMNMLVGATAASPAGSERLCANCFLSQPEEVFGHGHSGIHLPPLPLARGCWGSSWRTDRKEGKGVGGTRRLLD